MDRLRHLTLERLTTPLGVLLIVTDGKTVRAIDFEDCLDRLRAMLRSHAPGRDGAVDVPELKLYSDAAVRLGGYFAGDCRAIDAIRVSTLGTPFQLAVWTALRMVPAGNPATYGQMAARLGTPGASRAVGAANGANPVSVVIPCHRLTGSNGALTGYAGGLERKAWLLSHEAGLNPSALAAG